MITRKIKQTVLAMEQSADTSMQNVARSYRDMVGDIDAANMLGQSLRIKAERFDRFVILLLDKYPDKQQEILAMIKTAEREIVNPEVKSDLWALADSIG